MVVPGRCGRERILFYPICHDNGLCCAVMCHYITVMLFNIGSVLGLVGPVLEYCDWVRLAV